MDHRLDNGSGVSREVHAPFYERLAGKFRWSTLRLVHCKTEYEAQAVLVSLTGRFATCGLELHLEKTKIIYCKDGKRKDHYSTTKFTFLGYDFRSRSSLNSKTKEVFQNFSPAVSNAAAKSMRMHIRQSGIRNRSDLSLQEIAEQYNPILRGWIHYYGYYHRTRLNSVMLHFNKVLTAWAMHKYRKLRDHKTKASLFIIKVQKENPELFSHWKQGLGIGFA